MRKSFTLIELMIVIVVLGITATLGVNSFSISLERARSVEARTILGEMFYAQQAFFLANGRYAESLNDLYIQPPSSCTPIHYFYYSVTNTEATATRCSGGGGCIPSNGKPPDYYVEYNIILDYNGNWSGTPGYY